MKLNKLIAKNVFKYDRLEIEFDSETYLILASTKEQRGEIINGVPTIVEFDNFEKSNGVGKSAIIELIVYGLFGQTLRGINDISKYHTGKFYIELQFDEKTIIRADKGIEIINNADGQKQLLKKTEGQQVINNIIKLDLDMLTFTNIFTPDSNFFKLDDGEKKDVLMKLINVDFIDDVYEVVKIDLDNLKGKKLDNVIEIYTNEIKNIDEVTKREEVARTELQKIQKYESGIKGWMEYSKQLKIDIENYKNISSDNITLKHKMKRLKSKIADTKYDEVEDLRNKLLELKSDKNKNDNKISDIKDNKISGIKDKISKVNKVSHCPIFTDFECEKVNNTEYKQGLIDGYNKEIDGYNKNIAEINEGNKVYIKEIGEVENKITINTNIKRQMDVDKADFESGKITYYKVKEDLANKKIKIKEYIKKNKELYQYKDIKVALQDIRIKQMEHADALALLKVLTDKKEKLEQYKIKNEQINRDIADLEVIKKFFGKDGLKQYAVSKIVKFLEDEINIMLSDRFEGINIKIVTSFDVGKRNSLKIVVNRLGNSVDFCEFSAGERRILEIVFQVAMNKLYQSFSNYRFNVIFLDEIFDCLDQNNTQVVVNLLSLLSGPEDTVYVVSHNPEIQSLFEKKLIISSNGKDSWMDKNV